MAKRKLLRMDNVGIVVESLDTAIFFSELGLTLEGRAIIEGEWAGRVTGLRNQQVEITMMVTPRWPQQARALKVPRPANNSRSPQRSGERLGLSPCYVRL